MPVTTVLCVIIGVLVGVITWLLIHAPRSELPPGWVAVPREPTDAMLKGACAEHQPGRHMIGGGECPYITRRRGVWRQMVEAAHG